MEKHNTEKDFDANVKSVTISTHLMLQYTAVHELRWYLFTPLKPLYNTLKCCTRCRLTLLKHSFLQPQITLSEVQLTCTLKIVLMLLCRTSATQSLNNEVSNELAMEEVYMLLKTQDHKSNKCHKIHNFGVGSILIPLVPTANYVASVAREEDN